MKKLLLIVASCLSLHVYSQTLTGSYLNIWSTDSHLGQFGFTDAGQTRPRVDIWGSPNKINFRTYYNTGGAALSFGTTLVNDALLINQDGNVGIGKTPSFKLDVNGIINSNNNIVSTNGTINTMLSTTNGYNGGVVGTITNHPFYIYTNSTPKMTIDATGNVGIGTMAPISKLQVVGGWLDVDRAYGVRFTAGTETRGTIYSNNNNDMFISPYSTPNAVTVLNGNGNVGIGITTPISKLQVAGGWLDLDRAYGVRFTAGNETRGTIYSNNNNDMFISPFSTPNALTILNGNGNVGIGTTTPTAGLHVTNTYDYNGSKIAAIFGNNYADWTCFGGLTAGRIRGSNEGYLIVESNPNGTGDKNLYLNSTSSGDVILVKGGGNVAIGTTNPNNYKLAVEGTIAAREVKVTAESWSDFVFHPTYKLRTLGEVEQFIKTNNHLPEIPTEAEVKQNGVGLGEMNAKLLQKIEELTLYMIEQQKKIQELEKQNQRISQLEEKIEKIANKQ